MRRCLTTLILFILISTLPGIASAKKPKVEKSTTVKAKVEHDEKDFVSIFDGKTNAGWEKGVICNDGCLEGDGCYTDKKLGDFVLRFEFKLKAGSNSGIGIRSEQGKNAAYNGMEIQVLDDSHPKYAGIKDWQHHGSIYGVVPAKTGHLKPTGEWNVEEISAIGNDIKVTLNGTVIVDANLKEVTKNGTIDGKNHPGLFNKDGYIRLCGHGGGVQFRKLRVKIIK